MNIVSPTLIDINPEKGKGKEQPPADATQAAAGAIVKPTTIIYPPQLGGSYPNPVESPYHLPQAWATFLSQPLLESLWGWYGHFTHKDYPHPESFHKLFLRWLYPINVEAYGRRYWKDNSGVIWARSSEFQSRGSLHYHSLIGDLPSWIDKAYHYRRWERMSGFCRIEKYESNRGAEYYLSKSSYAWKNGEVDLSPNMLAVLQGRKRSAFLEEQRFLEQYADLRRRARKRLSAFRWNRV
jgi:hypothetical protein